MRRVLLSMLLIAACFAIPAAAQTPTHTAYGTITQQSCMHYPTLNPDWLCWINFQEEGGETFAIEVEGQAIAQSGQIAASLPRRAYVLYVIVPAGIDFLRSVVRTQVRGYYLIDAGPATP